MINNKTIGDRIKEKIPEIKLLCIAFLTAIVIRVSIELLASYDKTNTDLQEFVKIAGTPLTIIICIYGTIIIVLYYILMYYELKKVLR